MSDLPESSTTPTPTEKSATESAKASPADLRYDPVTGRKLTKAEYANVLGALIVESLNRGKQKGD